MKTTALYRFLSGGWHRLAGWILAGVFILVLVYYGGRTLTAHTQSPDHLVVYAFSTQEEVLSQAIFPAFEAAWQTATGEDLTIEGVFGPSGTLAGQINLGAPADVAIFSNERNVDWLKLGKRVHPDTEPVLIAATPLVIIARAGNPANLAEFEDLAQPGLRLLHADPRSSGVGEWALLAEYGSAYLASGDADSARAQLAVIWNNVKILGSSARTTLTLFEFGAGDALVTYEQDALLAQERGIPLVICTPQRTILARHFAVIVDDNVNATERPVAEAFLAYLLSAAGQQILSQYHFRPATFDAGELPEISHPFTESDLGGWAQAYDTLIEKFWMLEIEPQLKLEPASTFLGTGE
jgi:ABC-type sulfate transport system substrate-binding protein